MPYMGLNTFRNQYIVCYNPATIFNDETRATIMEVTTEQSENPFSDYIVEQESFSGPLDLLLHLIRKDEVDIFEIDISRLTDQFVAYIKGVSTDNIENAGDFLIMAATLLEIKSRALLPKDEK